jgi:hypothetical protein
MTPSLARLAFSDANPNGSDARIFGPLLFGNPNAD